MMKKIIHLFAILMALAVGSAAAMADVRLPAIFSDNMVLQRDAAVPVWGWADPGEAITVSIARQQVRTEADDAGRWKTRLAPMPAGGPYTLTAAGAGENSVAVKNVLVGEVWVVSGQSNIEFGVPALAEADEVIAAANCPQLRLIDVANRVALEPLDDTTSRWMVSSPEAVKIFSAVGYLFGRDLQQALDVPVGIITSSWGGSQVHMWMSRDLLESSLEFQPFIDRLEQTAAQPGVRQAADAYPAKLQAWREASDGKPYTDTGIREAAKNWADPALDTADWQQMYLPDNWERRGLKDVDGAVWFRKTVDVPQTWQGKNLLLHLGPVDDADITFFNGTKIGSGDKLGMRDYTVPADLVKSGPNTIAVRVFDSSGDGGILPDFHRVKPQPYRVPMYLATVKPADEKAVAQNDNTSILAGAWQYKIERKLPQMPNQPLHPYFVPSGLFNGMIAPIVPFGIRGVVWYQGESNRTCAREYRRHFPLMIKDWRRAWGQGDFPFLFVQLPNYGAPLPEPSESMWAELREAQLMTLQSVPNTGMAVTIDIGEAFNIHPRNKQDVAKRLLLVAQAKVYGKDVVHSGPMYDSMSIEGNAIRLRFKHIGGGLLAKGGKLAGFAVAGEDRQFVWAEATIDGDTVVVRSNKVLDPVAVRYAWADTPECNLYNKAGLPASPFRTDDWPAITADKHMADMLPKGNLRF